MALPLLLKAGLGHQRRHPWQAGLALLAVALGVAVVVAVDLASESARRAFRLSSERLAGRATHQLVGLPPGVPEQLYTRLVLELGLAEAAPVVEGLVELSGRSLRLLGVDPLSEPAFRPELAIGRASIEGAGLDVFVSRPGAAVLTAPLARELGLALGQRIDARVGGRAVELELVGVLSDPEATTGLEDVVLVDVATAQELSGRIGLLDRIDLRLPSERPELERQLGQLLPPGVQLQAAGTRGQSLDQMTRAFRLNLTALSLLALLCGSFLVYNALAFSVVQRRPLIGMLRALGVTRRQVFASVVLEALLVGVVGTALGLLLGLLLGRGLVTLVTQTINDLYFVLNVRDVTLPVSSLLKALLLGVGASSAAALFPAREAASVAPREVLSRSLLEERWRRALPWLALAGGGLIGVGAILLWLAGRLLVPSFAGLFAVMTGFALMTPWLSRLLMPLVEGLAAASFGFLGRLAARSVLATTSRTAVATAALVVAVSVSIGVGCMIASFRGTVVRWLDVTLQSDVYISPAVPARDRLASLPPELVERLARLDGVAGVGLLRRVELETPGGPVQLAALGLTERGRDSFRFARGEPEEAWRLFDQGRAVLVSEPLAFRDQLEPGSLVELPTRFGVRSFPVAGVVYDYGSDRGVVLLSLASYRELWDDTAVSAASLVAEPGVEPQQLIESVRALAAGLALELRSNRALRESSLEVFDRTFTITSVLRLLAAVVAFIGVLAALMSLQLERRRELGVLRANGLTPRQLRTMVVLETGLMGLLAGLLSWPLGVGIAAIMVHVINRRSFGWSMQLELQPSMLLEALVLALVAALLAGVHPARVMSRTPPAAALREE